MAKQDIPAGYVYNPRTRGATETATGREISRRQVEKLRIAQETGTSGSFDAKAKKNRLMAKNPAVRLPRQLKVYRKKGGQKTVMVGQVRYRTKSFVMMVRILDNLPARAEVYVRMLAHPKLDSKYPTAQKREKWRWVVLSGFEQAGSWRKYLAHMASIRNQFLEVAFYEVIVRRIIP